MKILALLACSFLGLASGGALAQNGLVHPNPDAGWYFGVRAIAGASHEDTSFRALPVGASGAEEDSYDPQENFGAAALVGYGFAGWGMPLRAQISGSWMYRHDADMRAFFPGDRYYENNLAIWDARISLLADLLNFGWARFYAGAGLGAALLESEVSIAEIGGSAENSEWKVSPSAQAGIIFDDVVWNVDVDFGYRFRWFGDTESGTFSDGTRIDYENTHIHEVMLGINVPLGR